MQIRPEVYLIKGKASNLYLCVDEDGLALIDAGMPNEQNLVLVEIERLGYQPEQLKRILITHADIDHAGSLAVLQEASGATVYAGDLAAQSLQRGKSPKHLPSLIQWLSNAFFGYRPADPSCIEFIQDGDELPVLGGLQARPRRAIRWAISPFSARRTASCSPAMHCIRAVIICSGRKNE